VEDRPRVSKDHGANARINCWTATEAKAVLALAVTAGTQTGAFFTLALDSGARKSELLGLQWSDLDLDAGTVTISKQLDDDDPVTFGVTKTKRARTITLGADTIARVRAHRKAQREQMMANRTTYVDHQLVFAKEPADQQAPTAALGTPCTALTTRYFAQIIAAAGVRPITPHGLRHTTATLLLGAGVPVQVVAQRLGHSDVTMTLNTYAHSLPDAQRDAADRLGAVLSGRR